MALVPPPPLPPSQTVQRQQAPLDPAPTPAPRTLARARAPSIESEATPSTSKNCEYKVAMHWRKHRETPADCAAAPARGTQLPPGLNISRWKKSLAVAGEATGEAWRHQHRERIRPAPHVGSSEAKCQAARGREVGGGGCSPLQQRRVESHASSARAFPPGTPRRQSRSRAAARPFAAKPLFAGGRQLRSALGGGHSRWD